MSALAHCLLLQSSLRLHRRGKFPGAACECRHPTFARPAKTSGGLRDLSAGKTQVAHQSTCKLNTFKKRSAMLDGNDQTGCSSAFCLADYVSAEQAEFLHKYAYRIFMIMLDLNYVKVLPRRRDKFLANDLI